MQEAAVPVPTTVVGWLTSAAWIGAVQTAAGGRHRARVDVGRQQARFADRWGQGRFAGGGPVGAGCSATVTATGNLLFARGVRGAAAASQRDDDDRREETRWDEVRHGSTLSPTRSTR